MLIRVSTVLLTSSFCRCLQKLRWRVLRRAGDGSTGLGLQKMRRSGVINWVLRQGFYLRRRMRQILIVRRRCRVSPGCRSITEETCGEEIVHMCIVVLAHCVERCVDRWVGYRAQRSGVWVWCFVSDADPHWCCDMV